MRLADLAFGLGLRLSFDKSRGLPISALVSYFTHSLNLSFAIHPFTLPNINHLINHTVCYIGAGEESKTDKERADCIRDVQAGGGAG